MENSAIVDSNLATWGFYFRVLRLLEHPNPPPKSANLIPVLKEEVEMISDGAIILTTDPDPDPSISGLEMKFE